MNMIDSASALTRLHELKYFQKGSRTSEQIKRDLLEAERCMDELPLEVLIKYQALEKKYGKSALTSMRNRICLGCFITLPTSRIAITGDIYECDHCGRLLINED